MLKIYITDTVYEKIVCEEEKKAADARSYLYKLMHLKEMKTGKQRLVQTIKLTAEETSLFRNHPEVVMCCPSSLYILDITPAEALEIQESYGVVCLSGEQQDISLLIDVNDVHIALEHEPLNKGWDSVLDSVETLPSNALLLTDRYLFQNESLQKGNGFANVLSILDEVLPQRFLGGEYHVTIVFDIENTRLPFEKIASQLNRQKMKLARNYPIMMEVLGITHSASIYNKLHNRYIISNYFLVEAAHKLAAFNGDIGTARQTLLPLALFTESSLNGTSTSPLKAIEQTLDAFRRFSNSLAYLTDHNIYHYAVNGQVLDKCERLRNRMLKSFYTLTMNPKTN